MKRLRELEEKAGGAQLQESQPEVSPMSWGEAGIQAFKNIPKSGGEFIGNIYQAVRHPINTAGNVLDVAAGGLQNILPESLVQSVNAIDPNADRGQEARQKAGAIGEFYKGRYGSMEGIKQAIANDPVGVLSDVSTLATGGGAIASKIPGIVGKAGQAINTVGKAIDPLSLAADVAKPVLKGTGKFTSSVLGGMGTHTGGESIREAARAGYTGGQRADDFLSAMRGNPQAADVVTDAKIALSNMRKERGAQYRSGMAGVSSDKTILDFKPIDQALTDIADLGSFKGKSISRSTSGTMQKVKELVDEWRGSDPVEFHTPEGMDALKRAIGDIRDSTDFGTPSRLVADKVFHAVKGQIVKQAPVYAETMSGYEEASKLIKDIEKSFSLGEKASADTALRKLQSVMRNNVNTNYGKRLDLMDELEKSGGASIRPMLAGHALSSWTPRGLGNVVAGGTGAAALATMNPALVPLLAVQMPRLVGESVYYGAKGAGAVSKTNQKIAELLKNIGMTEQDLGQAAFQSGRLEDINQDNKKLAKALRGK